MKRESQNHSSETKTTSTASVVRMAAVAVVAFCCICFGSPARAEDEKSIKRFTAAMLKLSPEVDPVEAQAISETAHHTARKLARDYRVVGPAVFQNFLIHIGAREKGYCFHWARDIGIQLKKLRPETLDYHWGAAEQGTVGEHNVIVVTARGQDFHTGYIIDAWRNAGRLCWWPVTKDSSYHWKEDLQETAWVRDYGPVEKKAQPVTAAMVSKTAKPKAAAQAKSPSGGKMPAPEKSQRADASLEIKG